MRALRLLLALAAPLAAGCMTDSGEYEGPIHERFQVPEKASTPCISAAKRASKWCPALEKDVHADQLYGTNCNEARWDFNRHCR
jgi:hypothetical protein